MSALFRNRNGSSFHLLLFLLSLAPINIIATVPITPVPSIFITGRTYDPNATLSTPKGNGLVKCRAHNGDFVV